MPAKWNFSRLPARGISKWKPQRLAYSGLLMAWGEQPQLGERWQAVCDYLHATHQHWKLGGSYGGWIKTQLRNLPELATLIVRHLRRHGEVLAGGVRSGRWQALAVDGSKFACPRTRANQAALGDHGRPDGIPLLSLTAILDLATNLPWDFRVGPGTHAERAHLREMLGDLPPGALVVADAGFPGYGLCAQMTRQKRAFLLRVGANLHLLRELGYDCEQRGNIVYLWPNKQERDRQPPLQLRLIVIEDEARQPVYLITNVLSADRLNDAEAGEIYRQRWGIEVFFRTVKQTMQQHTLRSRTPETCYLEMTWAFLGVWMLDVMTAREVAAAGRQVCRRSAARARNCVRRAMNERRPCMKLRGDLCRALSRCLIDSYRRQRPKTSRNYPRKKQHKPPGPPVIKMPTPTQLRKAKQLTPITLPEK